MNNYEKIILDNGLKIFLVNDNNKHTTYINLIVKYGGLDNHFMFDNKEYYMKDGMAHFIEHYLLERNCFGDLMEQFGRLGIISNGLTGLNKTQYYIDTVDHIYDGLKVLIKGIHSPVFNNDYITEIKLPIMEEKRRSLDNKYSVLFNDSLNNVIDNNKFKSVVGDLNYLDKINLKDIKLCFDAFYRPSNEIIVIGGRFDKEKVINIIKDTYNQIEFSNLIFSKLQYKHKNSVAKKNSIIRDNTGSNISLLVFKLNTLDLKGIDKVKYEDYIYIFLKTNFGVVSKLYNKLINDCIIINGINYSVNIVEGYHVIRINAYTKNSKKFIDIISDYLLNKKYIFDEELFNLTKRSYILNFIARKDNIYSLVDPLIENIINFDYEEIDKLSDIDNMNYKEYVSIINSLDFSIYNVTKLIPIKKA